MQSDTPAADRPRTDPAQPAPARPDPARPAPAKPDPVVGEQAEEIIRLGRLIRQQRLELHSTYCARDSIGPMLERMLTSKLWRWFARPAWLVARARGYLRVGLNQLHAALDAGRQADGSYLCQGLPQFYLCPPLPVDGWVRVRATINSATGSRAMLYFDTGRSMNATESFELGGVSGLTEIDRVLAIRKPAYLMRFDPSQSVGRSNLIAFDFEPMSAVRFNLWALGVSLRKRFKEPPTDDTPNVAHGLQMLFTGQWVAFQQRLRDRAELPPIKPDYDRWVQRHALTEDDRRQRRAEQAAWVNPPTFSVIMPVYDIDEKWLRPCLDSVLNQIYPHWEFCIVDDASPSPHIRRVLDEYAAKDPRVKVKYRATNGMISVASNDALAMATGDYLAMIDHDDAMAEHALFEVAKRIVADPTLDWVYTDEDKITVDGKHFGAFFKPDYSPDYLLACMYVNHLAVYRASIVRQLGGWRSRFDGAQDYDLALRIVALNPKVAHVPDVLYHWRAVPNSTAAGEDNKPDARPRGALAIATYLQESGRTGRVEKGPSAGFHKVRYDLPTKPRVSLVIPTAGKAIHLRGRDTSFIIECVASVRQRSTYPDLELVVIDNDDLDPALAAALAEYDVKRVTYTAPFNLSRKINQGVDAATGEYVVLLNDDVEVITPDWVEGLLEHAQWPDVGCVGPQLLFPDGRLQHAGVILPDGNPCHAFYQFPGDHPGYYFSSQVTRNWSAVTGACLMVRRDVYQEVGGFNPKLPLNYNDVDFCLKVKRTGRRTVCVPHVRLYHHESVSKPAPPADELETFKSLWGESIIRDPYYNPNLVMHAFDFSLG